MTLSSWSGLARSPATSLGASGNDVEGRHKDGHDGMQRLSRDEGGGP